MKCRTILMSTMCLLMGSIFTAVSFAQTEALNPPVILTVGYQKVGHLAPMILIADDLKKHGVEIRLVEFARYADARTALLAGSLDVASIGPADLAIALSNGSTNILGIMSVGTSPKYLIAKKGIKFDSWDDIKGKKIGIAPGSAVWFQFAATLIEKGITYNSFNAVNIQGGGANFDAALQKGDVDAIVIWEPFETIPIIKGYGYIAKNLDYSISKSIGSELGMLATTKEVAASKRAALERMLYVYINKMKELEASPTKFSSAIARLTGLDADVSSEIAKVIKLSPGINPQQIKRQAKAFNELGVISKDVSGNIEKYLDASYLNIPFDRFFRRPDGHPISPPMAASPPSLPGSKASSGTAFRIANGQFVTNHHVIDQCTNLKVGGLQGGRILSSDPINDLALIAIPNDSGEIASIRTTRTQLNEAVTAAGFPLQGAFTGIAITNGTISRLSGLKGDTGQVQISAPVQPGNSGGPLLDSAGNVIGVVSGKLNAMKVAGIIGDVPQNVNFAITGNALRAFLDAKGVNYKEVGRDADLRGEQIAARASGFTVLVECR